MPRTDAADRHTSLNVAGFRALATAAGLLQLCRELEYAGLLSAEAIGRVRQAMYDELIEQAPRSLRGNPDFPKRLRSRLERLFSGAASLSDPSVMAPGDEVGTEALDTSAPAAGGAPSQQG